MTEQTNPNITSALGIDPTVSDKLTAALDQLQLDVIDETKPNEIVPQNKEINGTALPSQQMLPQSVPPPMMDMNFSYSQIMPMPHQGGYYPVPKFPDANLQLKNMNGPMLFSNGIDISGIPSIPPNTSPMGGAPIFPVDNAPFNPLNVPMPPLPPPPAPALNNTVWPATGPVGPINAIDEGSVLDDSVPLQNGPGAAMIGSRRQTFHAISTKDLIAKASELAQSNDKNNLLPNTNTIGGSTALGASSNVGFKTRTQSSSMSKGDRSNLVFLPPKNSIKLTGISNEAVANDKENGKDISAPSTYAAAYPYGGPLVQNTPISVDGGNPYGGMPNHFPGNYDFGSPFQPFNPTVGVPNSPIHPHSPVPPMIPSPLHMGPVPDMRNGPVAPAPELGGVGDGGVRDMPPPQHFQLMQQGSSPPPWIYGNPAFNPMMPSPHGPHSHHTHNRMHMPGAGGNGKNYGRSNYNRGGYMRGGKGKPRNADTNYYGQDHRSKLEDGSRYVDATLEEYIGSIYTLCKDQHGCRFLQKQLDIMGKEAADVIFEETKEHTVELMTDSFGNYLVQKLIERVTIEQRTELSMIASPHFVSIAKNPHGTRALQKLIECVSSPEEAQIIISTLKDCVVVLSKDLNGNHVIQKCLERLQPPDFQFIFDATCKECSSIATHRHGCCVLQRCLDFGTKAQFQSLCNVLLSNIDKLTLDPFGNYVVQYIVTKETERKDYDYTFKIANSLKAKMGELSVHKFGSNVIEKLLRTPVVCEALIQELLNDDSGKEIELLLNDSYGNYVLQTTLDVSHKRNKYMYDRLNAIISPLLVGPIKNTPHGKRIAGMLRFPK
ncbi:Puf4p KNAG_0D03510 [Huiozyma naganishii CBS 8797]|uniref:PUM-HD domain-containing protein n=1 Tax=Huiozyma naganishii (strain ATCC MYA-139 / BCRC 22969 / CBS 8797 / KCTC 17520 / NBRC 10181 / NCYC 3082 / Yp74L-3) TaxID=1071383 RepID=J7RY89_HUIN7|nr:hypothetical protein KNAG_0D03510 [Kazachstania naganishii CBS 8797]CCK70097.1 hypothetical protein KNAG_0D03510 [Kazachstania naganishii CBS 8797]